MSPPTRAAATGLDLTAYRGKVVYLDFWASWCGPCKQSFPYMAKLRQQYGPQGLAVVTVNLDKNRAQADAFLKAVGVSLPVTYDSAGKLAEAIPGERNADQHHSGPHGQDSFHSKGFFSKKTREYSAHVAQIINER